MTGFHLVYNHVMKVSNGKMLTNLFHGHRIEAERIDLLEEEICSPSLSEPYTVIEYGIYLHETGIRIGNCDLRVGMNDELYYAGNVGYRIYEPYRGHGYAYDAAHVLLQEAKLIYEMKYLIITCSPENTASKKTLEKLRGKLIAVAEVPQEHWLYRRGEKVKDIYFFDLEEGHEVAG